MVAGDYRSAGRWANVLMPKPAVTMPRHARCCPAWLHFVVAQADMLRAAADYAWGPRIAAPYVVTPHHPDPGIFFNVGSPTRGRQGRIRLRLALALGGVS